MARLPTMEKVRGKIKAKVKNKDNDQYMLTS
jgi:hypothetical protein